MVDFTIPMYLRVKFKENKKMDKYLDLAKEQKALRDMMLRVIPTVSGALGTIPKELSNGLEKVEIEVRAESIQTTVSLRSAKKERKLAVT